MSITLDVLQKNLIEVEKEITMACERSGRKREDVQLVAVSKTKPIEDIQKAHELGLTIFGENKPQEIRDKVQGLGNKEYTWHMIGNLQKNKIKYIVPKCTYIHSVDSYDLAFAIDKASAKHNVVTNILLQVNVSGEASKSGFTKKEVIDVLPMLAKLEHVQVKGLMTMAPYTDDETLIRTTFRNLKEIFIDIHSKNIDNITMEELSMGMTNDYTLAIEEGATLIRVGSGLFGERQYL